MAWDDSIDIACKTSKSRPVQDYRDFVVFSNFDKKTTTSHPRGPQPSISINSISLLLFRSIFQSTNTLALPRKLPLTWSFQLVLLTLFQWAPWTNCSQQVVLTLSAAFASFTLAAPADTPTGVDKNPHDNGHHDGGNMGDHSVRTRGLKLPALFYPQCRSVQILPSFLLIPSF